MFCAKCGCELVDEASFCGRCGAPVKGARQQANTAGESASHDAAAGAAKTAAGVVSKVKAVVTSVVAVIISKGPIAKVAVVVVAVALVGVVTVPRFFGHDLSGTYRCTDSSYWVLSITFSEDGTFRATDFSNDVFTGSYSNSFGTYALEMGSGGVVETIGNAWYWLEAEKTSDSALKVTMHTKVTSYNWDGRTAVFRK